MAPHIGAPGPVESATQTAGAVTVTAIAVTGNITEAAGTSAEMIVAKAIAAATIIAAAGIRGNSRRDRVRSGMREFESSHSSQAVRCSEICPRQWRAFANGGLSPDSKFGHFQRQIADSLRQIIEILPFLGDGGWRPGSICTA
jgi:hypothetical protein